MKEFRANMNTKPSYVSEDERKESKKEYENKNKEKNKLRVKGYHQDYYKNHKEIIQSYKKE